MARRQGRGEDKAKEQEKEEEDPKIERDVEYLGEDRRRPKVSKRQAG